MTQALSVGSRELVATVGGGGKTSLLQLLVRESLGRGTQIVATTTTAMYLKDLEVLGRVLVESDRSVLWARLDSALVEERFVGVVRGVGEDGKAVALPVEWVGELWATGWMNYIVVEADGSRGMSLKAFGEGEPQVPSAATIIVQVAGLDGLGAPLAEPYVHRALLLAATLGISPGVVVTKDVFLEAMREQLHLLRARWPNARIVTLLNKAESHHALQIGRELAIGLLAGSADDGARPSPDMVIVGSVKERNFLSVTVSEAVGEHD